MGRRIQALLSKIAAVGAVKRKGVGGLSAYGGKLNGVGYVEHKSGPLKGTRTKFEIEGKPVSNT